jgi:uncharacterized membrane protein
MRWWSVLGKSPSSSNEIERWAKRQAPLAFAALITAIFAYFAWCRFDTVHNQTFDLAFYTRMAWGGVRGDFWMPIVDAHVFGLHISPVLLPIGAMGAWIGTVNALILAQAVSAFGAAFMLSRLGRRRLGTTGAWMGALVLLLHPNMGHVLTYEAHPGTLALFPLAWAVERLDAQDGRSVLYACLGMLACREDLALVGLFIAVVLWRYDRRHALLCGGVCVGWFCYFLFHLHPTFAPRGGSFSQHLGIWGETPIQVLHHWFDHPDQLLRHVFEGARGTYLLRVLGPLALLPLVGWRLAIPAIPVLAMNLVSGFPTTPNMDSHYLTPALPFLAAAAILGASRLPRPNVSLGLLAAALVTGYALVGFHGGENFREDEQTHAGRAAIALVPADASVQAPDALLAHLAERTRLHRSPPPNHGDDYTIVDISHRERYAQTPTLLRTVEEPRVRNWLQRDDYGLIGSEGRYLVFARNADPRESEHLVEMRRPRRQWPGGISLSSGLRWVGAREEGDDLVVELLVTAQNPADLALRFDDGRVDLLCNGELGLTHLLAGDIIHSRHENVGIEDLSIGLIRTSGAPPTHRDPRTVPIARLRLQQRPIELRTAVPEEAPPSTLTP